MEKFSIKKSHINGSGLFVTKSYKKGEFIEFIHGPVRLVHHFDSKLAKQSMNWIGISKFRWVDTSDSMFRFINHSCNPNVAIRGERTVYALVDIPANTEIAMDYSLTEADPDWSIKCNCNSKHCRKHIGSITSLPLKTFKKYEPILSKKFKKIYLSQKN